MDAEPDVADVGRSWTIDAELQRRFADASGDHNPLHVDEETARRSPFGRVAVHGVHLLLASLEGLVGVLDRTPRRIRATFRRSASPGDPLSMSLGTSGEDGLAVELISDVWRIADVAVVTGHLTPHTSSRSSVTGAEPAVHDLTDLVEQVGETDSFVVGGSSSMLAELFPALTARLGLGVVEELAALSRLVGMEAPGLHSLLSELDVTIRAAVSRHPPTWTLADVDDRFGRVRLDVTGRTIDATVRAFVRPEPTEPSIADVTVPPDAFTGQRWLVVGGSRGLGAVATLLLHAGGAEVCATHLGSPSSAERLIGPLPRAHTIRFDADAPTGGLAAATGGGWSPTHLAWFASPPIFDGAERWSDRLHDRFREVYVERFLQVVDALGAADLLGVLWPSTVAVEQPVRGLAEYAEAKRAGEVACQQLVEAHPHLILSVPRFGRLATDQTASVLPVDNAPPAPAVFDALGVFARAR